MAKRVVSWTAVAIRQRSAILAYWTKRNGSTQYAKKIIELTGRVLVEVAKQPELYKSIDSKGIHCASVGHFSLYYRFDSLNLIVVAFWDNRQDPNRLLEIIKAQKQ
ncbi:MAG: plasmid stabilization protein [Sphingobacteriaceae bacterium]|nr:plasmid stabilization protein [Sphingobacteriaceae bacterium]